VKPRKIRSWGIFAKGRRPHAVMTWSHEFETGIETMYARSTANQKLLTNRRAFQLVWAALVLKRTLLTHLGRSVLCRSFACAQLSLAVAFSSIVVIAVIAACTCAHHARSGHRVVERTGIVWRSGAGSRHFVVFSGRIRGVDLRKQLFSEDYSASQVENALTVAGNIALKHRHFSRK
jgi:hypothetical protein